MAATGGRFLRRLRSSAEHSRPRRRGAESNIGTARIHRDLGLDGDLKYFVPIFFGYYHFVTETLLTLYELLRDHDQLEHPACTLWYQGRYPDIIQLFSARPVNVLPLEPQIRDGQQVGEGIETLKTHPLGMPEQFERLVPLSEYLMSRVRYVREEPGITLIRRADKRLYEEFDELHEKLAEFGLPVRVARFESMSFPQQVSLARNTQLLVAPHGAGTVNQIFMPRGSNVLELYPKGYLNWHTGVLATAFGHQYEEVEASTPGVIGRMQDKKIRKYFENNPWPTRAETRALSGKYGQEFVRTVRDVASYSIDPDLVIDMAERMLAADG